MKTQPWQLDVNAYDFRHTLSPQYGHLDTLRHVNNVAVHGFHTEARMRHLLTLLGREALFADDVLLRPRRTVTNFLHETHYPEDVICGVRLVAVGNDHYRLAIGLFQDGQCVSVQECLMGAWHGDQWVDLPAPVHAAFAAQLADDAALVALPALDDGSVEVHRYPSRVAVTARYADMDPDARIGELALARFVEQSRTGSLNMMRKPGMGLLVARVDIRYDRWVRGLGSVELVSALAGIGNSSFALRCGVQVDDRLVAVGESVMVLIDGASRRPTPLTAPLRQAMTPLMVAPSQASADAG
ncbi:acyl-CoA thioesterase [Salinisphaera aquimarina]|uniref:Acyl-CoA thioesterase n=1 Tax=Salinisphaera aquimarina TaxID=2094031 RepID=A0ABV7EKY8_9GAMM